VEVLQEVAAWLQECLRAGQTRLHWNQMFCSAERADNHAFIRNRLNVQALQENDE